jgi:hypothetical protein
MGDFATQNFSEKAPALLQISAWYGQVAETRKSRLLSG